jgi:uncharacterized metal-binding protein YceD (DUF177 family)
MPCVAACPALVAFVWQVMARKLDLAQSMKISIAELKSLTGQRLTFGFKEVLAGTAAVKPVIGELTVYANLSGVKLTGRVQTLLKLECDRCLRPFFHSLVLELDENLVFSHLFEGETKERELQRNDFVERLPESGILDIDDIVYQAVTLATPTYCFCGPECPGPPNSAEVGETAAGGASTSSRKSVESGQSSRPIDPRWENLKTLFPKQDSSENS